MEGQWNGPGSGVLPMAVDGTWSEADMQQALRESMESASVRVGTPLSPQAADGWSHAAS